MCVADDNDVDCCLAAWVNLKGMSVDVSFVYFTPVMCAAHIHQ